MRRGLGLGLGVIEGVRVAEKLVGEAEAPTLPVAPALRKGVGENEREGVGEALGIKEGEGVELLKIHRFWMP